MLKVLMHCARLRPSLAVVALLTVVGLPTPAVSADSTYTNPGNTVRIQVPDTWRMRATTPGGPDSTLVVPSTSWDTTNPAGAFNISATETYILTTFAVVDNGLINPGYFAMGGQTSSFELQQGPLSLNIAGEPANELDFIGQDDAGNQMATDVFSVAHKDNTYVLLFTARPEDIDALKAAGASVLTKWQWL